MKQLYYVIQTLLHGRSSNIIKVISLTLGLAVSILIFSRQAFEFDYDTCYENSECLYVIKNTWHYNGEDQPSYVTLGPVAGTIFENFPDDVKCVTVTQQWWDSSVWFQEENRFETGAMTADSCVFATLGISVISGDPKELANPDVVFLSRQMATKMFADQNPIGKIIKYNKAIPMTVKGIFEDFPENSSLYNRKVIMSLATSFKHDWAYWGWNGGDSYISFARLHDGKDVDSVNQGIKKLVDEIRQNNEELSVLIELKPVKEFRMDSGVSSMRMVWILLILAASILFTSTLNYVLISISSMNRRAKSIGIHKCNGANSGTIFGMFMWETAIILLVSLVLMIFLLLNFQGTLEDMLDVSLASLFGWRNIWAPLCVVVFLFIIGGLLPGFLFSHIPVTQVFRRYTEGKKSWKRPLLFVQFAGIAFIFGLLALALVQSRYITTKDRGFNAEGVVIANTNWENPETAYATIKNLPYVENVSSANSLILHGLSGNGVTTDDGKWMSMRWMMADKYWAPFFGLKLTKGRNFSKPNEVLVNETFLKMMHWEENPIGKQVRDNERIYGNIVGVLKNFSTANPAYEGTQPLFVTFQKEFNDYIHIRLKEPFDENTKRLDEDMKRIYPQKDIVSQSLDNMIKEQNRGIINFRNGVLLAAITILFITLMGLIGYINDEIQRRSKEIAIRKVNGAEVSSILKLLSKDVFWTSVPAIIIGTVAAWYVGGIWVEQFAENADFTIPYYIVIALGILAVIIGCVVIKSWHIANENPVKSIKSE